MGPASDIRSPESHPFGDVEVELTRMVFRRVLPTMVLALVGVTGTTSLLADLYHDRTLWVFNAVMSTISLARVAAIVAFLRWGQRSLTPGHASRWLTLTGTLTLLNFSVTSVSFLYDFSHNGYTGRIIAGAAAFILCSGVSGRLSARPLVEQTAISIMMGSLFWAVARSGEQFAWVVCLMLVMFSYGQCVALRNRFDITVEQLRSRQKLRALADEDALTGLPNRRNFEDALTRLCTQSFSFAVLFLDLDGFKAVNDTYGHGTGDLLLEHVARRLQGIVRSSDLIARLGGDEFAVLHAPAATRASAAALAQRIMEAVSAPYLIDGNAVCVGTSIGIQITNSEAMNDPLTLLNEADKALYSVKQAGKGTFRFAGVLEVPEAPVPPSFGGPFELLQAPTGCA